MKKTKIQYYKKSQGSILIVVLIILIVLAGVVVVWNIVYPMVQKNSANADTSIFSINLNIKEIILSETGASKVTVQRNNGAGAISSMKFIFYDDTGQSFVNTQNENMPKEMETKTYFFSPILSLKNIKSVSVIPIINNRPGMEYKSISLPVSSFPSGLVSWWRFDDSKDLLGKNNGNPVNGASIENGNLIPNNGHFDAGKDPSLDLVNDCLTCGFAISAWININSFGGKIISKGTGPNINYEVDVNNDGTISFFYAGNSIKSFKTISSGKLQHVVVSGGRGALKIFINGDLDKTDTANLPKNSENVYIGQGLNGKIEDIMIFNNVLTEDNVKFLNTNQLG